MVLSKKDLKEICLILQENIQSLEEPCNNCLYFDCAKNPFNKKLKKEHQWKPIINWKKCLKDTKEEKKRLKEILKKSTKLE